MPRRERLPDDFGFDDFLAALDAVDAPADEDLPTDADGCVEVVTVRAGELGAMLARLRDAGIDPHVEMPDEDDEHATVFVRPERLALARRVLGIAV